MSIIGAIKQCNHILKLETMSCIPTFYATSCSLPLLPLAVVMYLDVIFTIRSVTENGKRSSVACSATIQSGLCWCRLWVEREPMTKFVYPQVATALLVAGSTLSFWILHLHPPARTPAIGCSYNCMRLTYGSFQLTHMSRDDHAVLMIELWWPKLRWTLLQHSQHCHKGEFRHVSMSAQQRSLQCGQNLRGLFLRVGICELCWHNFKA